MKRALLIAITLTSSVAHAEDYSDDFAAEGREILRAPTGYVASGALRGKDQYELLGFSLEGGHRIASTPVFARVMGVAGTTSLRSGRGNYQEARAGAEARTCTRTGMLCGSVGLDLGIHRASFTRYIDEPIFTKPDASMPSELGRFDSIITVPRLTIDGGDRIRVRGVVEFPRHDRDNEPTVTGVTFSLALGIAY